MSKMEVIIVGEDSKGSQAFLSTMDSYAADSYFLEQRGFKNIHCFRTEDMSTVPEYEVYLATKDQEDN